MPCLRQAIRRPARSSIPAVWSRTCNIFIAKMKYSITAATSLLAAVASARQCQNLTIPIVAYARNGVFDIAAPGLTLRIVCYENHS